MKLLIITFFFLIACKAQAAQIRFGANKSHSPPLLYQISNPDLVTGGFIYEISVAIATDLKHSYKILPLAGVEIGKELTEGLIDIVCHIGNEWNHNLKNEVERSGPLYTYKNVLVNNKNSFMKVESVNNVRVGTVTNFAYKDLEASFNDKNKKVTRVDSASVADNVVNLINGNIDYVVMSEIEYSYYKKKYPDFQRSSFEIGKTDFKCVLSKKSWLSINQLNQSVERLKKKKVFQEIYNRYLNSKTMPVPILYGIYDAYSPPFFLSDNSTVPPKITSGVLVDLALAIGNKLNRPLQFVFLSRNRMDVSLFLGESELICNISEVWSGVYAKDFHWSVPISKQVNYIVSNKVLMRNTKMKSIEDLKGKTVGTRLGFVYPSLTKYFEDGSVKREDVVSGVANVAKLNHKRVNYIILNNREYDFYKKKYPDLLRATFEFDPTIIKCAVSKKSDLKIDDVNSALEELKKSDQLQKILN